MLGGHYRIEVDGIARAPARLVALTDRVKTEISLYDTDYAAGASCLRLSVRASWGTVG